MGVKPKPASARDRFFGRRAVAGAAALALVLLTTALAGAPGAAPPVPQNIGVLALTEDFEVGPTAHGWAVVDNDP